MRGPSESRFDEATASVLTLLLPPRSVDNPSSLVPSRQVIFRKPIGPISRARSRTLIAGPERRRSLSNRPTFVGPWIPTA